MITWVLYLCIGILIGGMAGFYFAKLDDFSKKQKQELEEKLQKSEQELVEYKDQVTAHFIETANLINNMTESYQKVHEHLANGSVELCNNAVEVNKLTVSSSQLLASAETSDRSDADEITSLAESEAPKDSNTQNNNNSEIDAAKVSDPEDTDSLAADSTSPASSESTFSPQEITSKTEAPADSAENTDRQSLADNPVLETMAVAEEDDAKEEAQQEDQPANPVPGSRMVH